MVSGALNSGHHIASVLPTDPPQLLLRHCICKWRRGQNQTPVTKQMPPAWNAPVVVFLNTTSSKIREGCEGIQQEAPCVPGAWRVPKVLPQLPSTGARGLHYLHLAKAWRPCFSKGKLRNENQEGITGKFSQRGLKDGRGEDQKDLNQKDAQNLLMD